jgi:hypothetical protein
VSRDPSESRDNLPPWLRGVPLPPRPADASPPPAPFAPPETAGGSEPLPDWLRDLSAGSGAPGAATLPPWLQEEAPAAPPPTPPPAPDVVRGEPAMPAWLTGSDATATPNEEALPDWLRDLAADQPAASQPSAPAATPEWLDEPSPISAPPPDDVPAWLRDVSSTPPTRPSADDEQLPDWLRADSKAEEPSQPETPLPSTESTWMSEPSAAHADDAADVPEWLRAAASDETALPDSGPVFETGDVTPFALEDSAPETPAGSPPLGRHAPDAAPGWLADLGAAADDAVPAWLAPDAPQALQETQPPAPLDVPAWLVSDRSPEPRARAGEADVPAWLRDIDAEAAPTPLGAASAEPPPVEEDIPDWLRAVPPPDTAPPPATPAAPAQPIGQEPDLPDWLREDSPQTGDLPDWLRASGAESPSAPPEASTSAQQDDAPSWLQAPSAEPPAGAPGDPALPPWLTSSEADQPQATTTPGEVLPSWLQAGAPEQQRESEPDQETLPSWLQASEPEPPPAAPAGETLPPWLQDDHGQPLPTATSPGEAGLPEWLRGAGNEPPAETEPPVRQSGPAAPTAPRTFDWFDDQPSAPASDSDLLGGAELPAWLRAETEPQQEPATVDTRSVDWLTRLGVQDEEMVATAAPAMRLAPPRVATRSAAQVEATALLRQLAATPYPEAPPAPTVAPRSVWRRLGLERAVYLLLLLALLAGLLLPSLTAPLQGAPQAPGASAIFAQIDALGPQDVVLVGYEWDARRISELRPLEQAVMRHLIARNAKLVLVSTDPQGTLLLYDLRDELTAAQYRQNGEGYLLLGYKPGGELALRTMAQDFQSTLRADFIGNDASISALATGLDTGRPLGSVRDFAMTVVLADDAADVQAWMEQIRPVTAGTDGTPGQPMLFLLPAEAAPIVQPYMAQDDVWSLAGYQGALAYQALRGTPEENVNQAAANMRFATLAFVVLLVAGGVTAVLSKALGRRRSSA